jgi:hypothetical protein
MVPNAIECFNAKIEWLENDIGTPHCMVVTAGNKRVEGVFACVSAWPMAAVVAEGDGLGQGDVEAKAARYRSCNLCDFECVSKSCSLMVVGENEDLCFSRKSTEGRRVENSIAITFKAGSELIGIFFDRSCASTGRSSGPRGEKLVILCFTFFAADAVGSNGGRRALAMSEYKVLGSRGPLHGGDPFLVSWCSGGRCLLFHGRILPYG